MILDDQLLNLSPSPTYRRDAYQVVDKIEPSLRVAVCPEGVRFFYLVCRIGSWPELTTDQARAIAAHLREARAAFEVPERPKPDLPPGVKVGRPPKSKPRFMLKRPTRRDEDVEVTREAAE
jgi:hypothetical protein